MSDFEITILLAAIAMAVVSILLQRRAPHLAVAGISTSLLFGMIVAAEVGLGILGLGERAIDVSFPSDYYSTDAHGVVEPLPGSHRVVATHRARGEVIYDVTYTVDEAGRRVTPGPGGPFHRYCVFVGDSFTYGEGVKDEETLPAAYARLHPGVHVYNYGFHGAGPFDVLARLETTDFSAEVAETAGTVVYTFIDEHVLRTRDFIRGATYRGRKIAYQVDADGNLVRCGTWNTCRPLRHRLMRMLGQSRIVAMARVELPPNLTRGDFERTAQAICRMNAVVREKYSNTFFHVLFYPGCRVADRLAPLLERCGVAYTDLSTEFDGVSPPYVLSIEDRHPTPEAYARVAAHLP